jgi:hypothetical protein
MLTAPSGGANYVPDELENTSMFRHRSGNFTINRRIPTPARILCLPRRPLPTPYPIVAGVRLQRALSGSRLEMSGAQARCGQNWREPAASR